MVGVAGAVGAMLRYLTDHHMQSRHHGPFPWGTFTVNIAGSFILGVLTGFTMITTLQPTVSAALRTGLCGALTTFSTFTYDTTRLITHGDVRTAMWNVAASLITGLAVGALGLGVVIWLG